MDDFYTSTGGSLGSPSCTNCEERQGSRKGLRYDWDGVPFEEIEFRLDSPVIDEDIYSMSDEELLQFAEDHGLRPEMFTNGLPYWTQRDGSSEDVWERFMGYEITSDPRIFNKLCQVFLSVTGHPFESDYGEEFDNENLAQQIVTKLDNEL